MHPKKKKVLLSQSLDNHPKKASIGMVSAFLIRNQSEDEIQECVITRLV